MKPNRTDCRAALTGRVCLFAPMKELINAVGGPLHPPKVSFGFFASTDLKRPPAQTFHWTYSPYYKGRYETPTKNFNGLNNMHWVNSAHDFPIPCQFRFSRRGSSFKAEIRHTADGEWRTLFEETAKLPDTLIIGPYLNQVPTPDPGMFFRVEFDQIKCFSSGLIPSGISPPAHLMDFPWDACETHHENVYQDFKDHGPVRICRIEPIRFYNN